MKRIVCYGDSNTYGLNPETNQRYPREKRWTGILQNILGDEYLVVEEGLNGRTTVLSEPGMEYRNGYSYLEPCLWSHIPVNYLVLMLGTNDTKTLFGKEAGEIARQMRKLIELSVRVLDEGNTCEYKILLVIPPEISDAAARGPLGHEFDINSTRKSKELAEVYKKEAELASIDYLDFSQTIKPSDIDGIHLPESEHEKIAKQIAEWVRS